MVIITGSSPATLPKTPEKPMPETPTKPAEPTPLTPFEPGPAQPDPTPDIDPNREHEECWLNLIDLTFPKI